jgi:cytochrome P450
MGLAAPILPPDVLDQARRAGESLGDYFADLIEQRRSALTDDILSGLIRAEEAGDRLSNDELISQAIGLLIAGFETTIGLIGNGVRALIEHPSELAKLRARPELIGKAVEECLRYDGPIVLTVRILHEDAVFGGSSIPTNTMVWAMLAAANRDPEQFPEPDRFDIERASNDHVAFGGGPHFCLGYHLAQMEAQAAIGTLVRRLDQLRLESPTVEWGRSLFRVPSRLPISFRKASPRKA